MKEKFRVPAGAFPLRYFLEWPTAKWMKFPAACGRSPRPQSPSPPRSSRFHFLYQALPSAICGVFLAVGSNGEWATSLQLPPGEYQYRLRVDGQWHDHLEARKRVPNPYGSENCVLFVS